MSRILNSVGEPPILADGAIGTELQRMGLGIGECGDAWNIDHPDRVLAVHQAYVDAGAQIITTNSFRSNRYALKYFGFESRVPEFNLAATRIASEAAGEDVWVMGSVGPFGGFMKPFGDTPETDVYDWLYEQSAALVEGGVDIILLETMFTVEEMQIAIKAARDAGARRIAATMSFNKVDGDYQTMKGVTIEQGVDAMLGAKNRGKLRELEDARQIDLKDQLPVFERDFLGGGAENRAGVVDEDIDAAKLFFHLGKEIFGASGGGEIGAEGRSVSANRCCCFGCGPAVAVAGDRGSGLPQRNGDRGTETAGRAGDQGYFVIESEAVENVR